MKKKKKNSTCNNPSLDQNPPTKPQQADPQLNPPTQLMQPD